MHLYRVNAARDSLFHAAVASRHLTNSCHIISDGAPRDINTFFRTDVKVYYVIADPITLQALDDDLEYGTTTKDTFQRLGSGEIYI